MYNDPSWANAGWLALDVVCAIAPLVPAVGVVRHAGKIEKILDKSADAAKAVDKATDAAKIIDKSGDAVEAANKQKRVSSKTLRNKWENSTGEKWPKDPKTGKNMDVSHKKALADGGTNDISNIEPKPRDEHIKQHKDAGDFERWGSRVTREE